jgi:hypothetical protein
MFYTLAVCIIKLIQSTWGKYMASSVTAHCMIRWQTGIPGVPWLDPNTAFSSGKSSIFLSDEF